MAEIYPAGRDADGLSGNTRTESAGEATPT